MSSSKDQGPRIGDDEAKALWRRAAELQVAAERAQSRLALAPADEGLTLEQVAAAAEGAGITPDYVRLALAETRLADAADVQRDRWTARWLRRVVDETDAIELTRSVAASPERVLEALRAVSATPSFELMLEDTIGQDPLRDAVLVYRAAGTHGKSTFSWDLNVADVRVVLITVRADGEGTLLRVRAPLFRRGVNLALTGATTGLFGFLGASGGTALGAVVTGMLGAATVIAAPAIIGAGAGAALGVATYRTGYRWGVRKGTGALQRLLQSVALQAEDRALPASRAEPLLPDTP